MKRDINLVKEILQHIELSDSIGGAIDLDSKSPFPEYNGAQITYHVYLLIEAGYLKGHVVKPEDSDEFLWATLELTWNGHEFLDVLKDKEVLNKIMSLSKDGITSLSFDLLKDVAKKLITTKAEKYLGLKG